MANKPLKSIKFPGLSDTYTVPEVDSTLTGSGKAADAKAVGDQLGDLKSTFGEFVAGEATANNSRNIYIETIGTYNVGEIIYVEPLSCSNGVLQYIYVYGFVENESTKEYQWNNPTLPLDGVYITLTKTYDKIRIAFRLETAATATATAILGRVNATDVAGRMLNDERRIKSIETSLPDYRSLKINCLGDSFTYGYVPSDYGTSQMSPTWSEQMAADFNCTVRNYGITNNVLSNNPGGSGTPMCLRYTAMDDDADVVIVMGGTNDFLRVNFDDLTGAPLGTIDSADDTTFYGAYNALVQGLIEKYMMRKTRIILMVPPMRNRSDQTNGRGFTLMQYQQAVRDIANKYALPYVDWAYDAGISAHLISTDTNHIYTYDGIHIQQEIVLGWILPMIEAKIREVLKR